ncbi:MAG TPA: acyl-CoA dehydrogenase family protein [Polyangiaceae bacterium]|nr:acyl-CoA dehydrogenase family protein [Polyangiaceae bacterium]
MDFIESEEQAMLRKSVREIAAKYGHEYYAREARAGKKADALWKELAEAGFLGVNLPAEHGGGGLGIYELALVCEELAAAGTPFLLLIVSPAICGTIIARYGTAEQQAAFLPGLCSGSQKMAFAITEPDAGSNSHDISTRATPDGDGFRLNGTKYFISGHDEAENVLVVANTGAGKESGRSRLSLFVVPTQAAGLSATHIPVEIQSPEKQFTLFFDNVFVPRDRLIGEEGSGLKQVFMGLVPERITGAALANGLGLYALDKAARYARDRKVWGSVPIGAHQGIAHPLAKAKIEVELARLMTSKAAWSYDHGVDAGEAANMAKYAAAEAGIAALDQAIQTHGGNGMATEFGLADLWGMARLLRTAPVSREMVLNYVAQHSLRLPRSYGETR